MVVHICNQLLKRLRQEDCQAQGQTEQLSETPFQKAKTKINIYKYFFKCVCMHIHTYM